jgi:hypothetical protein
VSPSLEETVYKDFVTSSPTTGAAADADGTPTAEVFEDATDTAVLTPTVVKRTGKTGNYRVPIACTAANGFEAGKSYNVVISATVGGVAAKAAVLSFVVRTRDTDDLMPTYTQPNGFLAATFPGTVASPTNITAASGVALAANQDVRNVLGTLTTTERTAIANEVETQIIDETDSEKVLAAITDKIASVNPSLSGLTLAAIASAVRDVLNTAPAANSLGAAVNAVKAKTENLPAAPAAVSDVPTALQIVAAIMARALTQRNVSASTASTVEDALSAARAQGAGAWALTGTTLTLKNPDGTTFRSFTLDSATAPTSRV